MIVLSKCIDILTSRNHVCKHLQPSAAQMCPRCRQQMALTPWTGPCWGEDKNMHVVSSIVGRSTDHVYVYAHVHVILCNATHYCLTSLIWPTLGLNHVANNMIQLWVAHLIIYRVVAWMSDRSIYTIKNAWDWCASDKQFSQRPYIRYILQHSSYGNS